MKLFNYALPLNLYKNIHHCHKILYNTLGSQKPGFKTTHILKHLITIIKPILFPSYPSNLVSLRCEQCVSD